MPPQPAPVAQRIEQLPSKQWAAGSNPAGSVSTGPSARADAAQRGAAVLDLLIIGGGINGLGIAVDAAHRGLSVLLVEKGDFGGGTTASSSRLIHGGLRYLQYGELGLVAESLRERSLLVRQWPHLVRPIQLLIPDYRGDVMPGWK